MLLHLIASRYFVVSILSLVLGFLEETEAGARRTLFRSERILIQPNQVVYNFVIASGNLSSEEGDRVPNA